MIRKTSFPAVKRHWGTAPLCLMAAWAQAQTPASTPTASLSPGAPAAQAPAAAEAKTTAAPASSPGDTIGASAPRADFKLPELRDLGLAVPRPVRAATALMGLGRQRLALVVGIATVGARQVVDSAGRDAQSVAAALREGGFIVMLREDVGSADLRAALKEFQDRLQPGGLGFAYVTGLGVQVQGQNLLLPRDSNLDSSLPLAERQAQWLKTGVPVSDVVDALMGPSNSPRLLVVDAAYQNPALAGLPETGLTAQKLPPGMMALFGHPLGKTQDVPAVGALPNPPPTDAREIAASPFARALVAQLLAVRKRAPEVLRATHRSLYDGSLGQNDLWIAGDTDNEELAEASLLDVIPRTPEEIARELASQAGRALTRQTASSAAATATSSAGTAAAAGATGTGAGAAAVGEQSVTEVLERVPKNPSTANAGQSANENMRPNSARKLVADTPSAPSTSGLPDVPRPPSSLLSQAASVGSAISTAAGVAGTVAGVATTVATAAVMAKAAEAAATVSVATTALGAAGSVAGQMVALGARSLSSSAGEPQAAAAVQQLAANRAAQATATSAVLAAAPTATAATPLAAPLLAPAAPLNASLGAPLGVPGATPVNTPLGGPVRAPARAVATAASGDLPVEQFSPAALAAAAPTSAATAKALANAGRANPHANPDGSANTGANGNVNGAADASSPLGPAGVQAPTGAAKAGKPGLEAPDQRTVRNPEGGERPAYTPRTNAYGYAEGDTYTYQVMDTWKDEVISRYTTAIEEVLPDGQMLANGQRMAMDAQGRLKKLANADGTVSQFEPSQDLWWSNPKYGESRDLRFTETIQRANGRSTEVEWKGSTNVGKAQKIDTPAGEFEVLPIESSGWAYEVASDGLRSTKWSRTVWYSPKLGHPVAIDIQDADRLGKLLKRERVELLHAQASRAASP